jgi:hypothetical protein
MKTKYYAELTDTFGGDPNYSWVRRIEFEAPEDASDRMLVTRAKKGLGYTNYPCRKFLTGDTIELRPANECTVIFIGEI